jgi:hypothetical protein
VDKAALFSVGATPRRSTSSLDTVKANVAVLLAFLIATAASDAADQPALRTLRAKFSAAAALPLGSRPAPPDIDLSFLIGLPVQEIRQALGAPYSRSVGCSAPQCWSYRYGPDAAAPEVTKTNNDGTVDVVVTTGGPFLLIIGFSSHHVILANWQGQR